ncbi:MAG TPA: carboxypeptidase-like regulatory domain-containing protein, partial [Bacteroidales bacterium]|nr:carboxypeptidase-like regulatory domain-containing protein [Bacteroidales bacterium]
MKKIVFTGLLCLLTLSLFSQPPANMVRGEGGPLGTIEGHVIDSKTKKSMEFASVAVYHASDSSLVTGGISGPDGSFTLKNIPNGKFYLVANFMGYNKKLVDGVVLSPG